LKHRGKEYAEEMKGETQTKIVKKNQIQTGGKAGGKNQGIGDRGQGTGKPKSKNKIKTLPQRSRRETEDAEDSKIGDRL
jgi:hypothetical protein